MEKIKAEFNLLKISKINIHKMYEDARDEEIFNNSDLWLEFTNQIHDIEQAYSNLSSDLYDAQEVDHKCRARIANCHLQIELIEAEILKVVPECAKLVGTYGNVVQEPYDSSEKKLAWLMDYLAYLLGLNGAFCLKNLCWLYEIRSDVQNLQAYVQRFQPKENLWTSIFRLKVSLKNFEKDFDSAKIDIEKRAFAKVESVE